jgi:molybdopterin-guanine dinucleotide biosynthesis protein A
MDTIIKNCSSVILAGGENKRMPVLKAFIKINGEKIIERNLKIMRQLFKEIFIVTNQPELYLYLKTPLLGDAYNIRCPMTGIFTSLLNSSNNWVFISACDMPFINGELIKYMASKRDDYDAVVAKYNESNPPKSPFSKGGLRGIATKGGRYIEPLFAFYSKQLLPFMEEAILSDKTGIKDFLMDKRVRYIGAEKIRDIDAKAMSFINLNTLKDVERVQGFKWI